MVVYSFFQNNLLIEKYYSISIYQKTGRKQRNVTYIPTKSAKQVRYEEFLDLVTKVPQGYITRYDDICNYLCRKYKAERVEFVHRTEDWRRSREVSLWKVVSTRGVLSDAKLMSRELQQEQLEQEGVTIVPCGVNNRSLIRKTPLGEYPKGVFVFHNSIVHQYVLKDIQSNS